MHSWDGSCPFVCCNEGASRGAAHPLSGCPGQAPFKRLEREQSAEGLYLGSASAFKGIDKLPIAASHFVHRRPPRNLFVAPTG